MIYIIEHLEPRLSPWCLLEYRHISEVVGRQKLWFTNVRRPSRILQQLGSVYAKPVRSLGLSNLCILDPTAKKALTPRDARSFSYLVFGGILGDDPPQQRTKEVYPDEGVPCRNLGHAQMSTDTAVLAAKMISDGIPLARMHVKDTIEIPLHRGESIVLPYRYLIKRGEPVLPKGLIRLLKRKRSF